VKATPVRPPRPRKGRLEGRRRPNLKPTPKARELPRLESVKANTCSYHVGGPAIRAIGRRRQLLEQMASQARSLLECIELELSGVRDGCGLWHRCDPVYETVFNLARLIDERHATPESAPVETVDVGDIF
jgi:hypothetical protein